MALGPRKDINRNRSSSLLADAARILLELLVVDLIVPGGVVLPD